MKKGWETTQISAVAAVQSGAGFPDRYQGQSDGKIPFYKVSDMNIAGNEREMVFENNTITEEARRELGAFLFPQGSTIFPKIGGAIATNKKRLTSRDCCVDNNVMGVIPRPGKINSEFLFYFFLAHDLSEFANEAHLPSIRKTVVEDWPIILPVSLAEQKRIVGILDEAFEGIAAAKANAEKNLQNARALFESHLQSVFTQKGDGWQEKQLDDACDLITCGVAARPKYVDVGVPFLSAKNVKNSKIIWSGYNCISKKTHDELTKHNKPLKGDILYTRVGSFGEAAVIEEEIEFSVFVSLTLIKPKKHLLNNYFLKYYLNSSEVKELAKRSINSSGVGNLNVGTVRMFPIHFPSLTEQQRIVCKLDTLSTETQRLESIYQQKLTALEALKKSLLYDAFRGAL